MNSINRIIAGAMSGTSADGVDVALAAIDGRGLEMGCKLLHHHYLPYNDVLREQIFTARKSGIIRLESLAKIGNEISTVYARTIQEALNRAGLTANDLTAVAAHGQTLFHDPPNTIQWLDPALIAAQVGCSVISDFRRADCAAGGQGAPLVPFADYILFRHSQKNRVLLNIGGICNITCLKAGGSIDEIIAFDTGPGNCIIDHLCRTENPGGPGYDVDGKLSSEGKPSSQAVDHFLTLPYFKANPPKSTDGPAMIAMFESSAEMRSASFTTRVSTAALLTVSSVLQAIAAFCPFRADEMIISGGGVHNTFLLNQLRIGCKGKLALVDELSIPAEAKEAIAFALLGAATLDQFPANVPSVTGARRAVILGSVTPKP